jgi:hypothetical protein
MDDIDEAAAGAELIAAKDAYRADPSPENKAAKAAAAERLQAIRNTVRADRPTTVVADTMTTEA